MKSLKERLWEAVKTVLFDECIILVKENEGVNPRKH